MLRIRLLATGFQDLDLQTSLKAFSGLELGFFCKACFYEECLGLLVELA